MRGGGLPKFFSTFHKLYIGSIWGWGGGGEETPAQIFWHIGVHKKWYKLSKLGEGAEGWVRGNLDKIQKNSYFFRETFPKRSSVRA